ncbi:unnamed protein product [Ciceribacter sp. T2.26MG-112.2]|nr:unnamed protein product [Ciceribacter naphthalenivorans]
MERHDDEIAAEEPELLQSAMAALEKAFPGSVRRLAAEAGLEAEMFCIVSGVKLPEPEAPNPKVINLFGH